ncbi:unnamed protein product [Nesidiocoris tenuis]|uniref:Uncharacterized protein n=1 Tax=Nesidiocoris tenuis TaxID=355587 RepID=A0A6H5HFA4_9HEMI|nr:unnamed protein product [Nesidiocoris tenuis]
MGLMIQMSGVRCAIFNRGSPGRTSKKIVPKGYSRASNANASRRAGTLFLQTVTSAAYWPKAYPVPGMAAETIATTFILNWVSRFDVPQIRKSQSFSRFWIDCWGMITHGRPAAIHRAIRQWTDRDTLKNAIICTGISQMDQNANADTPLILPLSAPVCRFFLRRIK